VGIHIVRVSVKPDPLQLKQCQLIHFIRWVGRGIRVDPGEADTVGAAAFGGQVRLCLVTLRPGPGEAEAM
jgi:hypothetical protein